MLKVIQIGSTNFILDSDPRISELVDEAKQLAVENTREQIKQLRLDICETMPLDTVGLPILLTNLEPIWNKANQTCRRRVMDALILDEPIRVTGRDNLQYDITLTSRVLKNGNMDITKESV
jgi:hypothetical protein